MKHWVLLCLGAVTQADELKYLGAQVNEEGRLLFKHLVIALGRDLLDWSRLEGGGDDVNCFLDHGGLPLQ